MPSPNHQHIFDLLVAALPNQRRLAIVDYGCGDAQLLKVLPSNRLKWYRGFDISRAALQWAAATCRSGTAELGTARIETARVGTVRTSASQTGKSQTGPSRCRLYHVPTQAIPRLGRKNSADAVVAIGVLQYLDDDQLDQFLEQSRRVLKPDGVLIVSTTADHAAYRWVSLYRWLLPHRYYSPSQLRSACRRARLRPLNLHQKGLVFGPLFSNVVSAVVDGVDRVVWRSRGRIGPVGRFSRRLVSPLLRWEYRWPVRFGYTLYLVARPLARPAARPSARPPRRHFSK
ncbi:MAG: hypothetical protein COU69_00030 [Candidatus Pacebacteria bacterium CG10_big_fil_rev_8_21_14_0_10_56_10]|nr:MAG: hypothetical protein COU69_00030 [Candidatus Pacebacteria bacterium CG10_big_fil_rev_8_21_14_0_10_56_10]